MSLVVVVVLMLLLASSRIGGGNIELFIAKVPHSWCCVSTKFTQRQSVDPNNHQKQQEKSGRRSEFAI